MPKGCKSGFVTCLHYVVQQEKLQLVVISFLVGDVLPHKNMFLDTLLVQGLLVYKTVVGL